MRKLPTLDIEVPKKPITFRGRLEVHIHDGVCKAGMHSPDCGGRGVEFYCRKIKWADGTIEGMCAHITWSQD